MNRFLFVAITLFASAQSFGIYDPRWERPIWQANLTELHQSGQPVFLSKDPVLTLNRRDGQKSPTSMTFSERIPNNFVPEPGHSINLRTLYVITQSRRTACGDIVYSGMENVDGSRMPRSIVLTDHRSSICEIAYPAMWDVRLGNRLFQGNPEPVYTIQGVNR